MKTSIAGGTISLQGMKRAIRVVENSKT